MLTETQLEEMRIMLDKAENPLFFFDADPDGLCSYLLLKKHYKKGVGVCLKTSPKNEVVYGAATAKHKPDLVVLLDKPIISQETIDEMNVPILWLDHHPPIERDGVKYFNPMNGDKPDNRCTTYWAYRVTKENPWIAITGIIADWQIPEQDILEHDDSYPELLGPTEGKTPPDFLFTTDYGTIVKMFSFAIKGSTDDMNDCIETLEHLTSPKDLLEQTTPEAQSIYEKYEKLNTGYDMLLNEALAQEKDGNVFVYTYPGGTHSYTGGLANELLYKIDADIFVIGREKEGEVRMSVRSKANPILPALRKALDAVNGNGGGHAMACGASVDMDRFSEFITILKKEYNAT